MIPDAVTWHEAECGGYSADLETWRELAGSRHGSILELGCGTGRVALDLARRGHRICGVDLDPRLTAALDRSAVAEGLEVEAVHADVRELDLGRTFALILAPMQLLQLLGGPAARRQALGRVRAHLAADGLLAAALLPDRVSPGRVSPSTLPDVREQDGWVYSSLPTEIRVPDGRVEVERRRQLVAPDGALHDQLETTVLARVTADALEVEAGEAGMRQLERRRIAPTPEHLGSTVVILERR